jgi:hypothetical protein
VLDQIHKIFGRHRVKTVATAETRYELPRTYDISRNQNAFQLGDGSQPKGVVNRAAQVSLLPRPRFLEQLRREQLRAWGMNSTLSIAIFSVVGEDIESLQTLHDFSRSITNRMRETDIRGWYTTSSFAVLILDADEAGAASCVERLRYFAMSRGIAVTSRIYSESTPAVNEEREFGETCLFVESYLSNDSTTTSAFSGLGSLFRSDACAVA